MRAAGVLSAGDVGLAEHAAQQLAQLVRVLAAIDVLCEAPAGGVMLTPLGETLRSDRRVIGLRVRLYFSQTPQRIYGDLLACVRTGEPAPQRLFGKSVSRSGRASPRSLQPPTSCFA